MLDVMKATAPAHFAAIEQDYYEKAKEQSTSVTRSGTILQIPEPMKWKERIAWTIEEIEKHLNEEDTESNKKTVLIHKEDIQYIQPYDWAELQNVTQDAAPSEWSRFEKCIRHLPKQRQNKKVEEYLKRAEATAKVHEEIYDQEKHQLESDNKEPNNKPLTLNKNIKEMILFIQ